MAETLTFEKVWEMFQESKKEADLRKKEIDQQMKETAKQIKETNRMIGDLGNRFGELAEHLVAPNIKEKFKALNITCEQMSQGVQISDSSGEFLAEIDILLENGDTVIAVEVKSKPLEKDVDKHVDRMEILRRRADKRRDTRKFRGAIAGAIMNKEIRSYIHKTGFYAIEQTGDTVKINIPKDFTPREW